MPASLAGQAKILAIFTLLLLIFFAKPLYDLIRYALQSELFSHVLLIPFISGYLILLKKDELSEGTFPDRKRAIFAITAGLAVLLAYRLALRTGALVGSTDYLTWTILSFLLLFLAACQFCLGRETLRILAFPLGFLAFMVPFPDWLTARIETFLQHASAIAAQALFGLIGMPVIRDGLRFQLPGIRLEVAQECSGIHSTLVLVITSLLAGQIFLRTPWRRSLLFLAVIPLGILRNAFRICTIGHLCVRIGPEMINSLVHRRGGPVFFVVSLVPLFLLLWFLRKSEPRLENPRALKPVN